MSWQLNYLIGERTREVTRWPSQKELMFNKTGRCFLAMLIEFTVRATTIETEVIVQQGYVVGCRGKDGKENGCKIG